MKETRNKGDILITLWNAFGSTIVLGNFVFSMIIGGNAINGCIENGQYFVGNHGEYVEVSETLWLISRIWDALFWTFLFLTPIGDFVISHIQEKIKQRKNRLE